MKLLEKKKELVPHIRDNNNCRRRRRRHRRAFVFVSFLVRAQCCMCVYGVVFFLYNNSCAADVS